jgi:hypothetical protein
LVFRHAAEAVEQRQMREFADESRAWLAAERPRYLAAME